MSDEESDNKPPNADEVTKMSVISPHPDTNMPSRVWRSLREEQFYKELFPTDINTPIYDDKIRFVCLSDTHSKLKLGKSDYTIPPGDILLHAGDFTMKGGPLEIETFNEFLAQLPHKKKIIIAGNHDLPFDDNILSEIHLFGGSLAQYKKYLRSKNYTSAREMLTNVIYLQDSMVTVCGVNIYGSPWQPRYCDWAFNCERGEDILKKWNCIPENVDILMTHGPPVGHGDETKSGINVGCVELLSTVQKRVKPKYHVFGHIHEGYGVSTDGTTTYINAACCTKGYKLAQQPIIFDFPLPKGQSKSSLLDSVSVVEYLKSSPVTEDDGKTREMKIIHERDIEKKAKLLEQLKITKSVKD